MKLKDRKGLNYSGIYLIRNIKSNKCYIGQAKHIGKRIYEHIRSTNNPDRSDYNYPLHRAIRKYGIDNFELVILEACDNTILNEREQYWINKYDCKTQGYNQTLGGYQSIRFIKLTEDDVNLIIKYLKETTLSFKAIAEKFKINVGSINKINVGLMWHNTKNVYPIRPLCAIKSGNKYNGKAVAQIDLKTNSIVKVFPSVSLAAKSLNNNHGTSGSISKCCRGLRKTLYGYKWQFISISEKDWLKLLEEFVV